MSLYELNSIVKTEVTNQEVVLILANGAVIHLSLVHLSPDKDYLHLHFSGIDGGVSATSFAHNPNLPKMKFSNYVDIEYKSK